MILGIAHYEATAPLIASLPLETKDWHILYKIKADNFLKDINSPWRL